MPIASAFFLLGGNKMADKNGIVIGVGFDPEIDGFINEIKAQMNNIDWNEVIGLSESFDRDFKKIAEQLQALKREVKDLGVLDLDNLTKELSNVSQTTYRLNKQMAALMDSLPIETQAKMNKSLGEMVDVLSAVGQTSEAVTESLNNIAKASSNSIDVKSYEHFRKAIGEIQDATNTRKASLNAKYESGSFFKRNISRFRYFSR